MASALWDTIFGGDVDTIFKGQFGFALVRDYDPTTSLANWSPFDSATGEWSSTLLTTDGFVGCGYFDENGLEFNPNMTTADTKAWQSRQKLFTDITEDTEDAMFTAIQRTPVIEAIETNLPLAAMGTLGQAGYQYTKPLVTVPIERQWVFGAVFMTKLGMQGWARIYTRATMTKTDKLQFNAKTETQAKLTLESFPDAVSGFAVRTLRDGPGWRALGGTTATPGTPVATLGGAGAASLAFTAPASKNGPFTYKVFVGASVVALPANQVTPGGTASNPVLALTGLTAGATTFKVQAIGSNLSGSSLSAASNSVTIT